MDGAGVIEALFSHFVLFSIALSYCYNFVKTLANSVRMMETWNPDIYKPAA